VRIIRVRTQDNTIKFDCPICQAKSLSDILYMSIQRHISTGTYMLLCRACGEGSVWKQFDRKDNYNYNLRLVDPILPSAPKASADMPDDVSRDYEEARLVAAYSSRSAAALLRLALQKLCKHLGEPGAHIDTDIRSLAKRPEFGDRLIKAADTLRIAGNNAVHPGEMDEQDIDNICNGLFGLLNLIVHAGITQPKEWDAMYQGLPEKPRQAAEKKDGRT
jgi:transcription elongation factor Elf1